MDFAAFLSNLGNNLGFGLIVTLIGMLTVFFGLVQLIGLIKQGRQEGKEAGGSARSRAGCRARGGGSARGG